MRQIEHDTLIPSVHTKSYVVEIPLKRAISSQMQISCIQGFSDLDKPRG